MGQLVADRYLQERTLLNRMQDKASEYGHIPSRLGTVTAELVETKQILQKAREESMQMASCLSTLQEELKRTKRELQQLMQHESDQCLLDLKIEELKYVEDSTKFQVKKETTNEKVEFQKKKYVRFAKPPSVAQILVPESSDDALKVIKGANLGIDLPVQPLTRSRFYNYGTIRGGDLSGDDLMHEFVGLSSETDWIVAKDSQVSSPNFNINTDGLRRSMRERGTPAVLKRRIVSQKKSPFKTTGVLAPSYPQRNPSYKFLG
ncbi:Uncharacterized protein Fot_51775 [Forsythia ovata]|uniref:Uncharacterized protein n=1 Tax=Forsythia ovata TaxID=205694 RepID=A0ABD1PWJ5_9LAMI